VQLLEKRLGFGRRRLVALRLGQLDQAERVVELPLQRTTAFDRSFQMRPLAQQRLRPGGVAPERGVGGLGVQLVETADGAVPVKDASSAARSTA